MFSIAEEAFISQLVFCLTICRLHLCCIRKFRNECPLLFTFTSFLNNFIKFVVINFDPLLIVPRFRFVLCMYITCVVVIFFFLGNEGTRVSF